MLKSTILSTLFAALFVSQTTLSQCISVGNSLATSYVSNNSNKGEMFNIVATNTVTILCFDLNLILGSNGSYEIYYKVGSYVGSESNAAAWTLIGSNPSVPCVGFDTPSPMDIPINIIIPAGQTYSFYITANDVAQTAGIRYTNNAGYTTIASDANISIAGGIGKAYPFATNYNNRSFNGTVHYALGNVLPVTFIDFTATPINQSVLLEWETESENDSDYFEVERSSDGKNWDRLFITKAAGESNTLINYQELDSEPLDEISYYRLILVDLDGARTILKSVSLNNNLELVGNEILVFPNPTTEKVRVLGDQNELDNLKILNSIGQDISENVQIVSYKGYSEVNFNDQQPGIFILKTKTNSQILIKK
ncbi:hypothetical protein [Fluviicola sp.]|uniref:hypothetical protein n=1 Tax=Fluviicola sp. TaxID=1917219 RepID=UPI003D2C5DD6